MTIGNSNPRCPVVIALPITGEVTEKRLKMPMLVPIFPDENNGQTKTALIDCVQIRVLDIDKRIKKYIGYIDEDTMKDVDKALQMVLQLSTCPVCASVLLPIKNHCVNCKMVLVAICENCHSKINNTYRFCPHCGLKRGGFDE